MTTDRKLVYIHDPMCSWCWGFNPVFTQLAGILPDDIKVSRLLGGLAPDSDDPMPESMRRYLRQTWKKIAASIPGTRFNHDFWTRCQPRRSTWPACRAVISARQQGVEFDAAMTLAIQKGYYLQARNPSDDAVLIEFSAELGLDAQAFAEQLNASSTHRELEQEMRQVQQLGVTTFPSLVLLSGSPARPIEVNYTDAEAMLTDIIRQ